MVVAANHSAGDFVQFAAVWWWLACRNVGSDLAYR
jgi:hypothetical protein